MKNPKRKKYDKQRTFSFPTKKNPLVSVTRRDRIYAAEPNLGHFRDKSLDVKFLIGRSEKGRKAVFLSRDKSRLYDSHGRLIRKRISTSVTRRDFRPKAPEDPQLVELIDKRREVYARQTSIHRERKPKKPKK